MFFFTREQGGDKIPEPADMKIKLTLAVLPGTITGLNMHSLTPKIVVFATHLK